MPKQWRIIEREPDTFDLAEDGYAALYGQPIAEVERFIDDFGDWQADEVEIIEQVAAPQPYVRGER